MSSRGERQIVSIAAAPGWSALFQEPDDEFSDPAAVTLAAWALVKGEDDEPQLVGLVQKPERDGTPPGTFGFANDVDGFVGYSHRGLQTKPI